VRALLVERSLTRFATARLASAVVAGAGGGVGPLRLVDMDPPELPGPRWYRVRPRLAGICGSDLATLDGRSSRWFEPIVSFPFVPGHEVVGDLDGTLPGGLGEGGQGGEGGGPPRVVIEPVLCCSPRGIDPPCPACAEGRTGSCERISFGRLRPGLQTGYCADTGGGWSVEMVAHESQLHPVPAGFSDEEAVMVEPTACAVHAALAAKVREGETVAVLGAGTLGLGVVAALRHLGLPGKLLASAKHPEQRALAAELGADMVAGTEEVVRAVRRVTRSLAVAPAGSGPRSSRLAGGADVVVDCVGSAQSLAEALAVVRPRGRVVLAGMPGSVKVDLAPLWQREVSLCGAYTYGTEERSGSRPRTFELAFELVRAARLGRLVSAWYPLERHAEAIAHASSAGRRGAVKVVFMPQEEAPRPAPRRTAAAHLPPRPAGRGPRPSTGRKPPIPPGPAIPHRLQSAPRRPR
jgi:threonine dehydrogenase-like Zn-dependent dehydrogenase